jgi:hypothetical protein
MPYSNPTSNSLSSLPGFAFWVYPKLVNGYPLTRTSLLQAHHFVSSALLQPNSYLPFPLDLLWSVIYPAARVIILKLESCQIYAQKFPFAFHLTWRKRKNYNNSLRLYVIYLAHGYLWLTSFLFSLSPTPSVALCSHRSSCCPSKYHISPKLTRCQRSLQDLCICCFLCLVGYLPTDICMVKFHHSFRSVLECHLFRDDYCAIFPLISGFVVINST